MNYNDIPGFIFDDERFYLYIFCLTEKKFVKLIEHMAISDTSNMPKNGLLFEGCMVKTPDGGIYHGVSYKDKSVWEVRILNYANEKGILTAKIEGFEFVISSGNRFNLSDCIIEM